MGKGNFFFAFLLFVLFRSFSSIAFAEFELRYDWTKTPDATQGSSVVTDNLGNVYVMGSFNGTVDFDPGPLTDELTSIGTMSHFVSKFSVSGQYLWTSAVGGQEALKISTDSLQNVYVTGFFEGTTDFNPESGVDSRTANYQDAFLVKYDVLGDYQWVVAFGGNGGDSGVAVATDSVGNVYVTGNFFGTADFDPGAGTNTRVNIANPDVFLSKFNTLGEYGWTVTFGNNDSLGITEGTALKIDSLGNIYISGRFGSSVDFDPGGGTDIRNAGAGEDAFVTKYNFSGGYQWTLALDDTTIYSHAYSLDTDISGNIYIAGNYSGIVDFDPGSGTHQKSSFSDGNAFLAKYSELGNYQWVQTFGTPYSESIPTSIISDSYGDVYVSGVFTRNVDFDPGPLTDVRMTSPYNDHYDIFFSGYDSSGNYKWTKAVGGSGYDSALSTNVDLLGNVYLTGYFQSGFDFDPSSGFDWHTSQHSYGFYLTRYSNHLIVPLGPPNRIDGSSTSDTTPTFTFELTAFQSGSLRYRIQIDDDSDFSSPTVDYTSGTTEQGNNFFIVGQPVGSGSYTIGSEGQTLPNGTYHWRIYTICGSIQSPPTDGGGSFSINPETAPTFVGAQLDINSTIAIACDPSVTMNALVGIGRSTIDDNNRADCTVITNNSAGYALSWQASTDDLLNSQSDHFAAYSPSASTTPEIWDIPNTTSAWGAKLASTSEGYNGGTGGNGYTYPAAGWGSNDSYGNGLWLNIAASEPSQIMSKSTETDVDGEVQSLMFAAEIGADKIQPTGTYSTNVTVTAVTLSGGGGGGGGGGEVERLFSAAAFSNEIYVLDKDTFATLETITVTDSESLNINNFNGAAVQPSTGDVYVVANVGARHLGVVDLDTGILTRIGNLNGNFAAIAFADDGTLYGLTGDGGSPGSSLYTINPANASKTLLASYSVNSDGEALAFNPDDGLLYRATGDDLYAIDPGDPNNPVTIFENNGDVGGSPTALYYNGNDEMLWAEFFSLYSVDLGGPDAFYLAELDYDTKGLFGGM